MSVNLTITPLSPLISRDGRPFQAGQRMKPLPWIYPSTLAGSLRTLLGKHAPAMKPEDLPILLKKLDVRGPLPLIGGMLYLPAPADAVAMDLGEPKQPLRVLALRPEQLRAGEYLDFPEKATGLYPTQLPAFVEDDFKPAKMPVFWSMDKMACWLANDAPSEFVVPAKPGQSGEAPAKPGTPDEPGQPAKLGDDGFWWGPETDERMHVWIERDSGSAKVGMLFKTAGLDFPEGATIAARVGDSGDAGSALTDIAKRLDTLHPLGGERRLAHWVAGGDGTMWKCPEAIGKALDTATHVRMVLATPALFKGGWKPGWLNGDLCGAPPESPEGFQLRLVGASISRWAPISGFSLEKGKTGPKEVRRLVPAGGVYFFKIEKGTGDALRKQWLMPVSDDEQDRRDGFGLAAWGVWQPDSNQSGGK